MPPGAERMDAGVAAVGAATPLGVGQARDRFDGLDGLDGLSRLSGLLSFWRNQCSFVSMPALFYLIPWNVMILPEHFSVPQ